MRRATVNSLSIKLIAALTLSAVAALIATYLVYILALELNDSFPFMRTFFTPLLRRFGVQPLTYGTGLIFFILTFFILTRRTVKYINSIIAGVKEMEQGRLETRIPVFSQDELGSLAAAINNMADKLRRSIDEERRSEQAKRDLIISVSHDLRTPLTSIIGYQELLMDRSHHSDADLDRFAGIAHKKALRLQTLIDELFEYTKMSYNRYQLNPQSINLNELVGQIVDEFFPVFEQTGMECRLALPDQRITLWADGELLHRLLENLLNNAVKYGAAGVYVYVTLRALASDAELTVTNYGSVIPPEDLPHVFERFYRVEQSRSRHTGGTGLGLAIAADIVKMHSGDISVTSDASGTSFRILLPLPGKR